MKTTLIVVADQSRARIFKTETPVAPLAAENVGLRKARSPTYMKHHRAVVGWANGFIVNPTLNYVKQHLT